MLLRATALAGAVAVLSSCADQWPDSLDPSDWYATTVGEDPAAQPDQPVPGADEPYPNLADVPAVPENVSTPEEIDQVAESLSADLANAQYSTNLQRADDETTPAAMPAALAQPEVVEETVVETTTIEPGDEVDIVEAVPVAVVQPEPEELASPPSESDVAATVEDEQMEAAPAAAPEAEATVAGSSTSGNGSVETETIRDESGELVGTITRVTTPGSSSADPAADAAMLAAAAEAAATTSMPDDGADDAMADVAAVPEPEPVVVAVAEAPSAVASAPEAMTMEDVAAAVEPQDLAASDGTAPTGEGKSLVAQSERTTVEDVVVVPEYVATLGASQVQVPAAVEVPEAQAMVTAVPEADTAMADVMAGNDEATQSRVEQETIVDDETGDLVGSITRTIETAQPDTSTQAMVVATAEAEMTSETAVVTSVPAAEPEMVTETAMVTTVPAAEPEMVTETAMMTTVPAVQASAATVAPAVTGQDSGAVTIDFDALLTASGPTAGAVTQPTAQVSNQGGTTTDVALTASGLAPAQVLAAIIRFGNGSSALGAAERDIVAQLATLYRERGGQIHLVGHASRSANGMESADQALINFKISIDRATAVAEELMRQGVPKSSILVEAAGDSGAVAASTDEAQDRRVDVFFGA